ncbi:unnamed protein product, partial [Owenia fusiformis]
MMAVSCPYLVILLQILSGYCFKEITSLNVNFTTKDSSTSTLTETTGRILTDRITTALMEYNPSITEITTTTLRENTTKTLKEGATETFIDGMTKTYIKNTTKTSTKGTTKTLTEGTTKTLTEGTTKALTTDSMRNTTIIPHTHSLHRCYICTCKTQKCNMRDRCILQNSFQFCHGVNKFWMEEYLCYIPQKTNCYVMVNCRSWGQCAGCSYSYVITWSPLCNDTTCTIYINAEKLYMYTEDDQHILTVLKEFKQCFQGRQLIKGT